MTASGFWVVAALSSQTSGRPFTCSRRIGKSRLMTCGSKSRFPRPMFGTSSGLNSNEWSCGSAVSLFPWVAEYAGTAEDGTFPCTSASRGGVSRNSGTECTPGTPGKEKMSLWPGKDGATARGEGSASRKKYADAPGTAGVEAEAKASGRSGVASVSVAGTAPSSASVRVGVGDGKAELVDWDDMSGKLEKVKSSLTEGYAVAEVEKAGDSRSRK